MSDVLSGTCVLVVDDDPDGSELLGVYVTSRGATARVANSGAEALKILKTWRPDVLLLDISMPGMSGYELLEAIRKDPKLRDIPAVAITALNFENDRRRAAESGFAAHISKPYDCEALVYIISRLTVAKPSGDDPPIVRDFRAVLDAQGILDALGFLNRRSTYRFTDISRFDSGKLQVLHRFDRQSAESGTERLSLPPDSQTSDAFIESARLPFVVDDALKDRRLAEHAMRLNVRSYCGVPLRRTDGTPFGSLYHFDHEPTAPQPRALQLLLLAAPILSSVVMGRE